MLTSIFLSIVEISLSVSIIAAVLILLSPFLNRRYAAKWKYWIWIFLALRLLVPFSRTSGQPVFRLLQEASKAETSDPNIPYGETVFGGIVVELPPQITAPLGASSPNGNIHISLLDIAAIIWITGCLIYLSVHFLSYFHYKSWLIKKGKAIKDKSILQQLLKLECELHIDMVSVIESPKAASPMIVGFLNPILVLPKERYRPEKLYFILKHELIHLKRRDVYIKLLFAAANGVHWFNPLIWLMQKEAVIDMELSCDERVIQGADYTQRKAYTETLFSTLRKCYARKTPLSTQFYGGKEIMKKRFKYILSNTKKKNGVVLLLCAIALTAGLGTLIGCSVIKESKEKEELPMESRKEVIPTEPEDIPSKEIQLADIPQTGQIYGYVSGFSDDTLTINRQIWATPGNMDWKPEYDEDAGFEVIDAKEEDITYPIHKDCTYSILENHQDPVIELGKEAFQSYLQEMEYPVLWVIELENGQIKDIREQYRP